MEGGGLKGERIYSYICKHIALLNKAHARLFTVPDCYSASLQGDSTTPDLKGAAHCLSVRGTTNLSDQSHNDDGAGHSRVRVRDTRRCSDSPDGRTLARCALKSFFGL